MRIGKQDQPHTAIATSDADTITVRGLDLCNELIGKIGFTDYFYLLVTGERPTETQRYFTDACLAAIAEHGLVPSVQAARMTLAAGPDAWQGAVSAGLLGMGSVVAGSSEAAGRYLVELVDEAKKTGETYETVARRSLEALYAAKKKTPGIGHPQHSAGDPRANVLLKLADERGVAGNHIRMLRIVADLATEIFKRPLPINVSGAIPAVMLDVDFPLAALKGIGLLCRTAGLIGHLTEEAERPIGFILSGKAAEAIEYDGPEKG